MNFERSLQCCSIFLMIISSNVFAQADPSLEVLFTDKYNQSIWYSNSEGEGSSGEGSALIHTKEYRGFLQSFLDSHDIHSVIDIGCGDWELSSSIDWKEIEYIGYDVVRKVIEKNQNCYATKSIKFIHGDVLSIDLPSADLLICKDVLQHLTNEDISLLTRQFPKFKYCLITNDVNILGPCDIPLNGEIERGRWHPIDLTQAPFNLTGTKLLTYVIERTKKSKYSDPYTKQVLLIVQENVWNDRGENSF